MGLSFGQHSGVGCQNVRALPLGDGLEVGQFRAFLHGKGHAVLDVGRQVGFFREIHGAVQKRAG